MILKDPYNRPVSNLRISLTPACNLSCIYCHKEGEKSPTVQISAGDITEILQAAATFEIRSVKFTGGEPLLRPDLIEIVKAVPRGMESSLTTNGTLLADCASALKSAGLRRVNVSLDSLNPDTYKRITGIDRLSDVLAGIDAALDAGLTPVKLNMVVLEDVNDNEIDDFLSYVRGNRNLVLQLIELMHFNDCTYHGDLHGLEDSLASRSKQIITRRMHHRKKYCLDGASATASGLLQTDTSNPASCVPTTISISGERKVRNSKHCSKKRYRCGSHFINNGECYRHERKHESPVRFFWLKRQLFTTPARTMRLWKKMSSCRFFPTSMKKP
jgi:cyclic pyranopterin phosphate synthase